MKFFIYIKDNSQRVPRKNFLKLGKFELWEHLIRTLDSQEVFVDTDSEYLYSKIKKYPWVKCYKRDPIHIFQEKNPKGISPALSMISRFLSEYVIDLDEPIITPHVTSPFIKLNTILHATTFLSKFETVQSCTSHKEFAYFEGNPINFNPDYIQKTQNLKPIILGNGAFFIFTKKSFLKYKNRVSPKAYFYVLNGKESIEIDYPEDLELAKKYLNGNN